MGRRYAESKTYLIENICFSFLVAILSLFLAVFLRCRPHFLRGDEKKTDKKIHKVQTLSGHIESHDSEMVKRAYAITAMAWNNHGNVLVTGDDRGTIQISDETFRFTTSIEAHNGPVRGMSYSPLDNRLVSCGWVLALHLAVFVNLLHLCLMFLVVLCVRCGDAFCFW